MIPVEKAPIRKYFRAASLLFRLRLSLPVKIYSGIDMISIPRKRMSKVLKVAARQTPHKTKNIRAKYSDTLAPTFSISRPLSRKNNSVPDSEIIIKVRLKLLKDNMFLVSKSNMADSLVNWK